VQHQGQEQAGDEDCGRHLAREIEFVSGHGLAGG
jgi:hypothetical protein